MERFVVPPITALLKDHHQEQEEDYFTGDRWAFGNYGNPEYWQLGLLEKIGKGKRVLDIGIGQGRSSYPFAMWGGAEVDGIDASEFNVGVVNAFALTHGLPVTARLGDARQMELGEKQYDLVIMDCTFNHFEHRNDVVTVLDKAKNALKPGGYIFVRTAGQEDGIFQRIVEAYGDEGYEDGMHYAVCGCSGVPRLEPNLFLPSTSLVEWASRRGMNIIHSQTIPEKGRANIMYGEDWWPRPLNAKYAALQAAEVNGYITLVAQKPQE